MMMVNPLFLPFSEENLIVSYNGRFNESQGPNPMFDQEKNEKFHGNLERVSYLL